MPITCFDLPLPHGITLSCRASSAWPPPTGRPRVVLLHGFPEAAFAWDDTIAALGPAAWCLAVESIRRMWPARSA